MVISFIIFFSVLNGMMFQVAIPDIAAEFALLPSEVSWVMTGYILVFAVGALMYGKLADIYPVKRLITIGLTLMNAGRTGPLVDGGLRFLIAGQDSETGAWDDGYFLGAFSPMSIPWYSQPAVTAIAMEAFCRYLIAKEVPASPR